MGDDNDAKVLEEESKNWNVPGQQANAAPTPAPKKDDAGDFSFHPFANDKEDDTKDDEVPAPTPPRSPFDDDDEAEEILPSTPTPSPMADTEKPEEPEFTVDSVTKDDALAPAQPDPVVDKPTDTESDEPPVSSNADLTGLKSDFDAAAADIKAGIDKMSSILSDLIAKSETLESENKSLEAEKSKLDESLKKVKDTISSL